MATSEQLRPAKELAKNDKVRFPNESAEYRRARNALLEEEIELRRHIERVAEQRRALPPGGAVTGNYRVEGENGPVSLADLVGDKETLVVYSYMYGPRRKQPCPMCTSLMSSWDGEAPDMEEPQALVRHRRRLHPRYVSADDADIPAFNVFTRRDGTLRHFWSSEMGMTTADPGQDPRGAPDLMPIWTILDATPEGRGKDWYPKLEYNR